MDEIALSELIEQMKDSIRSFEHSRTTVDNYQFAWRALANYFIEHNQVMFSKQLAEQYILESKAKLDAGAITKWRYKINRQTVLMLIEYFECGQIIWKRHQNRPTHLHQLAFILLHQDYLDFLKKKEKAPAPSELVGAFQGNSWNIWNRGKSGISQKSRGTRSVPLSLLFRNSTSQLVWEWFYRLYVPFSGLLRARTSPNFALAMWYPVVLEAEPKLSPR